MFFSLFGFVSCFGWFVELEGILGANVNASVAIVVVIAFVIASIASIVLVVIARHFTNRFDPFAHGIFVVLVLVDNVEGGDPVLLEQSNPIGDSIVVMIVVVVALFYLLLLVVQKELDSHWHWHWHWLGQHHGLWIVW